MKTCYFYLLFISNRSKNKHLMIWKIPIIMNVIGIKIQSHIDFTVSIKDDVVPF